MIEVLYAHPYPSRSTAGAALLQAIEGLPNVRIRSLYDLYPDFDIDPEAERAALEPARLVVWMHPLYWYAPPALMQCWFEVVLVKGWAWGPGGRALEGKDCLWVTTTGSDEAEFAAGGRHERDFGAFVPAVEQTARFCGMRWLEPVAIHGAHLEGPERLAEAAAMVRERLERWTREAA